AGSTFGEYLLELISGASLADTAAVRIFLESVARAQGHSHPGFRLCDREKPRDIVDRWHRRAARFRKQQGCEIVLGSWRNDHHVQLVLLAGSQHKDIWNPAPGAGGSSP